MDTATALIKGQVQNMSQSWNSFEESIPKTNSGPIVTPGWADKMAVDGDFEGPKNSPDMPLLFDEMDTPELRPELLPGWLGDYAAAVALSTQTPPAMAVMLGLAVVATCTAKRFEVSPHGSDYCEPLNIWTAIAMPPASRKTAVVNAMTAPLLEYEKSEAESLAPKIKDAILRRRVIDRRIDKLEKDAANSNEPVQREALFRDIERLQAEMPDLILPPKLWTGDITPERLQGLLVDHGERMAVISDEGGIFENMSGLYSDGRANLDIFLKGHAGSSVRVDRQDRTANLDAPALSFGLAIQPSILADMAHGGKKRFRGNGTLARFLFAVPRSNVGRRDVRANNPIPHGVADRYRSGLFDLLNIRPQMIDGREMPRRLTLTMDALDYWYLFAELVEKRQGSGGDLEGISDWSGKLPGAALRVAGILHLAKCGDSPPAKIGVETIMKAVELCYQLIDHAKAAFVMMNVDQATSDAKAIFHWIQAGQQFSFRRGEVYRQLKGRFTGKSERLDKALRELEERAIVTTSTEQTKGRAATVYVVNTIVLEGA